MRDSVLETIILYGALGPASNMKQIDIPQRRIWSKVPVNSLYHKKTSRLPTQKLKSLIIKTDLRLYSNNYNSCD